MPPRQKLLAVVPPTPAPISDDKLDQMIRAALGVPADSSGFFDQAADVARRGLTLQGLGSLADSVRLASTIRAKGFDGLADFDKRHVYATTQPMLVELMKRMLKVPRIRENAFGIQLLNEGDRHLDELRCSDGSFLVGQVYVAHPYDQSLYVALSRFHNYLLDEKRGEFMQLAMHLGARSVSLVQGERSHTGGGFEASVSGVAGVKATASSTSTSSFDLSATYDERSPVEPRLPSRLVWYHHEPLWQAMAAGRLEGGLSSHRVSFAYNDDFGVDASVCATIEGLGFKAGGNFQESQAISQTYELTFWPRR
jgi:hypothetical protein